MPNVLRDVVREVHQRCVPVHVLLSCMLQQLLHNLLLVQNVEVEYVPELHERHQGRHPVLPDEVRLLNDQLGDHSEEHVFSSVLVFSSQKELNQGCVTDFIVSQM